MRRCEERRSRAPRRRVVWGRFRDFSSNITGGKAESMDTEIGRLVDIVVDNSLCEVRRFTYHRRKVGGGSGRHLRGTGEV